MRRTLGPDRGFRGRAPRVRCAAIEGAYGRVGGVRAVDDRRSNTCSMSAVRRSAATTGPARCSATRSSASGSTSRSRTPRPDEQPVRPMPEGVDLQSRVPGELLAWRRTTTGEWVGWVCLPVRRGEEIRYVYQYVVAGGPVAARGRPGQEITRRFPWSLDKPLTPKTATGLLSGAAKAGAAETSVKANRLPATAQIRSRTTAPRARNRR